MPNRLATSTSPYLLQHQDNPVDWWPWCDEAFAEARRRDVPVLLSVGYAACHWCHVMAHESFEDAGIAAIMNAGFVNVKVDREERPDVDAVYMAATQALTGRGGWPMTVFLTPDGRPFYAGTYFPPQPRAGTPSWPQLLTAIGEAWSRRRDQVEESSRQIAAALVGGRVGDSSSAAAPGDHSGVDPDLARIDSGRIDSGRIDPDVLETVLTDAVHTLDRLADRTHGGFGTAPKFPPSMNLEFLIRHAAAARLALAEAGSGRIASALAGRTLTSMAHSGMYDQLAGGFARYSVDHAWVVPHFEKMLYDNAQLARVYLHWWRLTGDRTAARIAIETCDWIVRDLGTPEGGFASSLDADTPVSGPDGVIRGIEGFTYVWTPTELIDVLGQQDGAWAAELLGVTPDGTFEHGSSTLRLTRDVWQDVGESEPVGSLDRTSAGGDRTSAERWQRIKEALVRARCRRPQPGRDDKVVAAWNGLAIAALAETGTLLDRPDLVAAAQRAADLMIEVHLRPGPGAEAEAGDRIRVRRVSREGVPGQPHGVLEDYGDVAEGFLTLYSVTGEPCWLRWAGRLLETVLAHFPDDVGGFHDTADDATDAALLSVRRPADPTDNAYPSGWSAAAGALLSYAALSGSDRHRDAAEAALAVVSRHGGSSPLAFGWALAVAQAWLDGPREVAVVGPRNDPLRRQLHRAALAGTAPGLVVAVGEADSGVDSGVVFGADSGVAAAVTAGASGCDGAPGASDPVPLLAGRTLLDGSCAGYVCRRFTCQLPTASVEELGRQLGRVVS